jgi:hypothetical protein
MRTGALHVRSKSIGADAARGEMHFEEAASVMTA